MHNNLVTYIKEYEIPPDKHSIINKKEILINHGKWKQTSMKSICPNIEEWKIKKLVITFSSAFTIVKDISNIKFPYLEKIFIYSNNIESIEELSRIYSPVLKILNISHNHIHTLTDLRKGHWRRLKEIHTSGNKIKEIIPLTEICCKLDQLTFHTFNTGAKVAGISVLLKIPISNDYETELLKKENRIEQFSVFEVLKKKQFLISLDLL